jgi:hypothetical protein
MPAYRRTIRGLCGAETRGILADTVRREDPPAALLYFGGD